MGTVQALLGATVYSGKAEAFRHREHHEESTQVLCIVSPIASVTRLSLAAYYGVVG
jgi:hypothetical protein